MTIEAMGTAGDGLAEQVRAYAEARDRRLACERAADRIKAGPEREAKEAILALLAARGAESVRLEGGLGTVSRTYRTTVTLQDAETACRVMLGRMREAVEDGLPLADCLLLQRSPLRKEALAWAADELENEGRPRDDFEGLADKLRLLGMGVVKHEDLSYTAGKGSR
ncbi:MAG: hypothetical protein LBP92_11330 [Deltaproteobacteria bacterium]|jgi:hypothetical protein|nr:hypothetical protein [Deltaproteobacteria bacterium]